MIIPTYFWYVTLCEDFVGWLSPDNKFHSIFEYQLEFK